MNMHQHLNDDKDSFPRTLKYYRGEVFRVWLKELFETQAHHGYQLHLMLREPFNGAPGLNDAGYAADRLLKLASKEGWVVRAQLAPSPEQQVLIADQGPAYFAYSVYTYGPNLASKEARDFAYGQPENEIKGTAVYDALSASLEHMIREGDRMDDAIDNNFAALWSIPVEDVQARLEYERTEGYLQPPKKTPRTPTVRGQKRPVSASKGKDLGEGKVGLTDRQRELLSYVTVEGQIARFGSDDRVPDWKELKYVLTTLGGEWRRTVQGFVFPDDIEVSTRVKLAQDNGSIEDPRMMDFYETPKELADWVVAQAKIKPRMRVLEPSAGRGALYKSIVYSYVDCKVYLYELNAENVKVLKALFGEHRNVVILPNDFLKEPAGTFHRIVMNPPFSYPTPLSDCDHVSHAIDKLLPNGRLVAIMGAGQYTSQNHKALAFHDKVSQYKHRWYENPTGSFLASGTAVRTMTLVLNKTEAV